MRLLFDQNLAASLVQRLADVYPGSRHVRDVGLGSADDAVVWAYAAEHGLTIVSKDADFHQLSFLKGALPNVAFSYSGGRGSGQVSERTAVLCSLAVDNWVLCADVLTHQDVVGSGYPPSDSLSSGMGFVMRSKVSVVADTLVISSDVVMKAYGKHPARHGTLVAKHPLPYNGRFFLSS